MASAAKSGRIVVLGGAGAMGRVTIRDLVETTSKDVEILIADFDEGAAAKLAKSYGSSKVRAAGADVTNVAATAKLLKGSFAVINSVHHRFNVPVMEAALKAQVHYLDLGGLFHQTKKQLPLHREFVKRDRLAILGVGAAPGVINVLARSAADTMDEVHEIHCLVGSIDRTKKKKKSLFDVSYSIATILEEASAPAALFTDGKMVFVEALSGDEEVSFPPPVGTLRPARTLHSEVATLPLSYRKKGIQEVSFRIAFHRELTDRLRLLRSIGLLSADPIAVSGVKVAPFDLVAKVLEKLPKSEAKGPPDEYEVLRAQVIGKRGGQAIEETVDCHVRGMPAWGFGVDVDTGCPPSIVAQMLLRNEITARGALPPEVAIPADLLFGELAKRRMTVKRHISSKPNKKAKAKA